MRSCENCKFRMFKGWDGMLESCLWYEIAEGEGEEAMIREASDCERYEEGDPPFLEEERYTPSSTAGDYGPSCPWNAPGMSIRDFI